MMNKALEYRKEHLALMKEWEQEGRKWIWSFEDKESRASFYADGVIDPEVWFEKGNIIRPLLVLKEVHENKPKNSNEHFNFVSTEKDSEEDDIWKGKLPTWRRVGVLAKGIFSVIENNGEVPEYDTSYRMVDDDYHAVLKRIAVINLKKFAGGKSGQDNYSKLTLYFWKHAVFAEAENRQYLSKQMQLISPNIIICCGKGVIEHIKPIADKLGIGMVLEVNHPSRISKKKFYYDALEKIKTDNQW